MDLVLVESAGKKNTLQNLLGPAFRVEASFGFLRDFPKSGPPGVRVPGLNLETFVPSYVVSAKGTEVLARLTALVKEAERVYLATDPDQEGEALAWHLTEALHLKAPLRLRLHELTATALTEGLQAAGPLKLRLVAAWESRRMLDRLCNCLLSPAVSSAAGSTSLLSTCRLPSLALRLLVEREQEIRAHKARACYGAELFFGKGGDTWKAVWERSALLAPKEACQMDKAPAEQAAGKRFWEHGAMPSRWMGDKTQGEGVLPCLLPLVAPL